MPCAQAKKGIHMRIMLVEDNTTFREAFKERLCGRFPLAIIEEAENGGEAIQKITEPPPEIIFMDFSLPGENGARLTQKIKAKYPNIHVAMLTSYDLPEYRQAAIQSGAERYFVKDSFFWNEVEGFIECHAA
jgi:DNA-binding NarL/FixJ family response regulator